MVSRRNFFSICVMMVTILILFQFSILVRDLVNNYDENVHMAETGQTSADAWSEAMADDTTETVIYVGSEDDAAFGIIRQWCGYTKRIFTRIDSLDDYVQKKSGRPVLMCLTGATVTDDAGIGRLADIVNEGQNVLFCDMPNMDLIARQSDLRDLMGIREVVQEQAELTGIRLFPGFLLGGDALYVMADEEAEPGSEIELTAPWYLRMSGTKSYMAGTMEDEEIENEDLPSLIWRNSYGRGRVFVMNCPYMSDEIGIGILSAFMYELHNYDLYPVVNAQNLSVVNFPVFAPENTEKLMGIYARNLLRFESDVMWPGLISSVNAGDYKMTGFMTPRLDYAAGGDLSYNQLIFYLKQFREQSAEAGLSMDHLPGISLQDKLAADQEFYDSANNSYSFGTAYVGSEERDDFLAFPQQGILKNIRTITGLWNDADLLSYCTDTIVAQGVTADGFSHPYLQDLRVRAIETSLGYSNILLDMKRISWPEDDDLYWEVLSDRYSSNINTHWSKFAAFDKTTMLESDERVRAFFSLDFRNARRGDTVSVEIKNGGSEHWFILRTHGETISDIEGGDYIELEEDVFLIHTFEKDPQIELKARDNKPFYLP